MRGFIFQSNLQVKGNEVDRGSIHMKCNGLYTSLSKSLQDPINDNWKIISFSVESGRQPLNQVNKINISFNGTNCYQLTNAHGIHHHCWDSFAKKQTEKH